MFYMTCGSMVTLLLVSILRFVDKSKDAVSSTLLFGLMLCLFYLLFILAILDDKFYDGDLLGIIKEFRNKKNDDGSSSK